MPNYSNVVIAGNLAAEPELKYTPNGKAVVELTMAVSRRWQDSDGVLQEHKSYIAVVFWGSKAESLAKYCVKGRALLVDGWLEQKRWKDKKGAYRSTIKVMGENYEFVDSNNSPYLDKLRKKRDGVAE